MEEIITFSSVIVVLLTFLFGYLERRASDRRQRTLEFLLKIIEGEGTIHEAHLYFAAWIRDNRVIENDEVSQDDDLVIIKLLDFYDLIADTTMKGVIDRQMIILHLGGRMRSAFSLLSNYIQHRRERLNRPRLYMPLETFINEHILNSDV